MHSLLLSTRSQTSLREIDTAWRPGNANKRPGDMGTQAEDVEDHSQTDLDGSSVLCLWLWYWYPIDGDGTKLVKDGTACNRSREQWSKTMSQISSKHQLILVTYKNLSYLCLWNDIIADKRTWWEHPIQGLHKVYRIGRVADRGDWIRTDSHGYDVLQIDQEKSKTAKSDLAVSIIYSLEIKIIIKLW